MSGRAVTPGWMTDLPLQQQSVLLLASRGPDGVAKDHPCKNVVKAYRATVFMAARYDRMLTVADQGDSFMSLITWRVESTWRQVVDDYFNHVDSLPHHYHLHLMHGAEILGYKHPDELFRNRWGLFYWAACADMHVPCETEAQMDLRLNDLRLRLNN